MANNPADFDRYNLPAFFKTGGFWVLTIFAFVAIVLISCLLSLKASEIVDLIGTVALVLTLSVVWIYTDETHRIRIIEESRLRSEGKRDTNTLDLDLLVIASEAIEDKKWGRIVVLNVGGAVHSVSVRSDFTFENRLMRERIWLRGSSEEFMLSHSKRAPRRGRIVFSYNNENGERRARLFSIVFLNNAYQLTANTAFTVAPDKVVEVNEYEEMIINKGSAESSTSASSAPV